jgi:hypothetical protein
MVSVMLDYFEAASPTAQLLPREFTDSRDVSFIRLVSKYPGGVAHLSCFRPDG